MEVLCMHWYFVRHGEIKANIKNVYAWWRDEGLTARGIRQAEAAARDLIDYGIDLIFWSPLYRTVQTVGIIGDLLQKQRLNDLY